MTNATTALLAEQDQDVMNGRQWWRDHDNNIKARIWDHIQAMGGKDDPLGEIVSRFAQIGMTHIALLESEDNPCSTS